jgi:hypothetical protein
MEQSHWVLPLKDGTDINIPDTKITDINKKLANREPITTADRTILWQDIAGGPRRYEPTPIDADLQEQVAIAFNDPALNEYEEVKCIWVKEIVSATRWNKYYASFPNYYKLGNHYDNVQMAYRLPVHMLSTDVEKCTPDEAASLQLRLAQQ